MIVLRDFRGSFAGSFCVFRLSARNPRHNRQQKQPNHWKLHHSCNGNVNVAYTKRMPAAMGEKQIGTGWQVAKWIINMSTILRRSYLISILFRNCIYFFPLSYLFHLVRAWNGKRKYNSFAIYPLYFLIYLLRCWQFGQHTTKKIFVI